MKLMLRSNVKNLGKTGDVVTVADGYGRNFLLPRGLAAEVNPATEQWIKAEMKREAVREAARVEEYKALAEKFAGVDITLQERVSGEDNLYGSVTPKEIAGKLAEQGIEVEADRIQIAEPIKKLGVHTVHVKLHAEVLAELKVWVVELKGEGDEDDDGDTESGRPSNTAEDDDATDAEGMGED